MSAYVLASAAIWWKATTTAPASGQVGLDCALAVQSMLANVRLKTAALDRVVAN